MKRPPALSAELIRALPKSDLHVHLDGSLRLSTLIELAKESGVKLPSYSAAGLLRKVFKKSYRSLPDYLAGFRYTVASLQTPEALERAAYELCVDNQEEGVRYVEIRFAPQLHTTASQSIGCVLEAVQKGIDRASREFNRQKGVREGAEPPFVAGIIVCALRFFAPGFSPTYAELLRVHADMPRTEVFRMASESLVRASIKARDERGVSVVGVDLAGQEKGYPASDHQTAYELAHHAFLGKTVHAGEDYGPESIFQALTDCHADRLGHGTWLFSRGRIAKGAVPDKARYIEQLVQYIADRRTTLEVCLTSNLQTTPEIASVARHPFRRMLKERLSCSICTDNRLVSRTTVTQEWLQAIEAFHLDWPVVRNLLVYGFKRSFYPGTYLEKRAYVRELLDYRDRVYEKARAGVV